MRASRGVTYYTTGTLNMPVPFPEDKLVCQWCPFCRGEDSLKRCKCLCTGEFLPYPLTSRGNMCPIEFESEEIGQCQK